MTDSRINQLISHLFRHEAGKMAAVLTRILGLQCLTLAEDIVQDTLLKAMNVWKVKGIPENPSAWLYTVAKHQAIDILRKQQTQRANEQSFSLQQEEQPASVYDQAFFDHEIEDSQLRMMFACCHPAIPYESQIALILKTLCGLSIAEIARAFLTHDETITKRLYRAREKIREEKIMLEIPSAQYLQTRLNVVLHTLYVLFNEGYHSHHADVPIRQEVCEEAMRLTSLLARNKITAHPNVSALLALMIYQVSREDARLDENGNIVLLQHQDRSRWNSRLMARADELMTQAAQGNTISEYHLEAAIAACHAHAPSFVKTDWARIVDLYEMLLNLKPDPIIELNLAIATGYAQSPENGLQKLMNIQGLEQNSIYHSALGDFYAQLNQTEAAHRHYQQAVALTQSKAELVLLQTKLNSLK